MAFSRRLRVFPDTNVWFSALYSNLKGSYPSILFKLAQENAIGLFYSTLVELELRHNLQKKMPDKIPEAEDLMRIATKLVDVDIEMRVLEALPEKDHILVATAIYNGIDCFITGNTRDFGSLIGVKIGKTLILTPKDFCLGGS